MRNRGLESSSNFAYHNLQQSRISTLSYTLMITRNYILLYITLQDVDELHVLVENNEIIPEKIKR